MPRKMLRSLKRRWKSLSEKIEQKRLERKLKKIIAYSQKEEHREAIKAFYAGLAAYIRAKRSIGQNKIDRVMLENIHWLISGVSYYLSQNVWTKGVFRKRTVITTPPEADELIRYVNAAYFLEKEPEERLRRLERALINASGASEEDIENLRKKILEEWYELERIKVRSFDHRKYVSDAVTFKPYSSSYEEVIQHYLEAAQTIRRHMKNL